MQINARPPQFSATPARLPVAPTVASNMDRYEPLGPPAPGTPTYAQMLAATAAPAAPKPDPYGLAGAPAAARPKLPVRRLPAEQLAAHKQELFTLIERINSHKGKELPAADFARLAELTRALYEDPKAFSPEEIDRIMGRLGKSPVFVTQDGRMFSTHFALLRLVERAAVDHPDQETRFRALLERAQLLPIQEQQAYLRQLGGQELEKFAAERGGELGQMVAFAMPAGPVTQADLKSMQSRLQGEFGEFLKASDDAKALEQLLHRLPAGPERDMLLTQPHNTRLELRTLKHAIMAGQLATEQSYGRQKGKAIDPAKVEKTIQMLLLSPRVKAILKLLHQNTAQQTGMDRRSAEHQKYLTSEAFLNKVQMLAKPWEPGLNQAQVALILENIGRVVAGKAGANQAELFGQVLQALEKRGVATLSVSPEDAQAMRREIKERLADPQVSPEEKSLLMESLPLVSDVKSLGQESYKLYKLWRDLQNPALKTGGKAAASLGGTIFKCLGPVGSAWGVVSDLNGMQQQVAEGNATGAQLKLASAGAGAGAAIFGGMALLCSGPIGWVAAGTAVLAASLGIAGYFFESDPFEDTCKQYNLYK